MAVSIATKAVRGAGWNLVAGVGTRVVALVGTLVLTRFIAPGEYGEIAAANITIITAMLLTDASVGQTILARQVAPGVCFHAFVLHAVTGLVGLGAVFAVAGPIAAWLDAPGMIRYLPGFALALFIDRLSHVPGRVLVRELRFRTVAIGRGVGELVFTGVALALAPTFQGDAIVIGNVVRFAVVAGVFFARADRRDWFVPQPLRWAVLRDLLGFGLPLSVGVAIDSLAINWDNMLVGRYFGSSTMGAYRLSRSLADTPITNFSEHLGDVLLPSFAKMSEERRRGALVRASAIMELMVFPLCVGLAAVAPTVVRVLLDPRWADIGPLLAVLSLASLARPTGWSIYSFLQAQQRSRQLMLISFFRLGATVLCLVTFGRISAIWACVAIGISRLATVGVSVFFAKREGVSGLPLLAGVLRVTAACVPMYLGVVLIRSVLERAGAGGTVLALLIEVLVGGVCFLPGALVFARPIVYDVVGLVREALARRSAAAPVGNPAA